MVDVHCALWTQLHDQQTSLQIKGGQTMIFSKPQTTLQTGDSKLTLEMEHRQNFQLPYHIFGKSYWILHVSKFQWLIRKGLFDNMTSYGPTLYWQNSMHFNYSHTQTTKIMVTISNLNTLHKLYFQIPMNVLYSHTIQPSIATTLQRLIPTSVALFPDHCPAFCSPRVLFTAV